MSQDISYVWCVQCKDNFLMRKSLYEHFEDSGDNFSCPHGHVLHIPRKHITCQMRNLASLSRDRQTTITKLRKRLSCMSGIRARYLNRLARGVCPYCGTKYPDIIEHIQDKHALKK